MFLCRFLPVKVLNKQDGEAQEPTSRRALIDQVQIILPLCYLFMLLVSIVVYLCMFLVTTGSAFHGREIFPGSVLSILIVFTIVLCFDQLVFCVAL